MPDDNKIMSTDDIAGCVSDKLFRILFSIALMKSNLPCVQPTYGPLAHWGRATYIWVNEITIIGSDNDLSPVQRKAII